jgi:hypothetical protein
VCKLISDKDACSEGNNDRSINNEDDNSKNNENY